MPRTFAALAIGEVLLLVLTGGWGLVKPDPVPDRHILLAVLTLLSGCLIQVVGFTYLTVTAKVLSQAVHLGRLDQAPVEAAQELKRYFTHALAAVVTTIVIITATGARHWAGSAAAAEHLLAAVLAVGVHVMALVRQYLLIAENAALVEKTLEAYRFRRGGSG